MNIESSNDENDSFLMKSMTHRSMPINSPNYSDGSITTRDASSFLFIFLKVTIEKSVYISRENYEFFQDLIGQNVYLFRLGKTDMARNSVTAGGIPKYSRSKMYSRRAQHKRTKTVTKAEKKAAAAVTEKTVGGAKNGGSRKVNAYVMTHLMSHIYDSHIVSESSKSNPSKCSLLLTQHILI